jgi:ribosomal protein L11 methyltransferase
VSAGGGERAGHPFRVLRRGELAREGERGLHDLVVEGSAFGGGTHPTTASCLEVLASLAPLDGARVLDLGSGSGILALAALRLGAAAAVCADVDPEAVESARRNGDANGLGDRLTHRLGGADDLRGERFDLVLANIGGELLLDEAERIAPLAHPGGRLVLSGLLGGWADELERAYAALGCRAVARRFPTAFCTLVLERRRG